LLPVFSDPRLQSPASRDPDLQKMGSGVPEFSNILRPVQREVARILQNRFGLLS